MDPPPFSWDSQIRPEWKSSRIDLVLSNILTFATFSLFALPSAHNNALIVGCVVSLRLFCAFDGYSGRFAQRRVLEAPQASPL